MLDLLCCVESRGQRDGSLVSSPDEVDRTRVEAVPHFVHLHGPRRPRHGEAVVVVGEGVAVYL